MQEEYKRWLKQAEADFDTAEYTFKGKIYYACANYCQQSVEKAIKSLYIFKKRKLVKTHSILKMAKELKVPEKMLVGVASLEPIFRESKYPDVSDKIPAEEYEEKDAVDFLNISEEILTWIKKQVK